MYFSSSIHKLVVPKRAAVSQLVTCGSSCSTCRYKRAPKGLAYAKQPHSTLTYMLQSITIHTICCYLRKTLKHHNVRSGSIIGLVRRSTTIHLQLLTYFLCSCHDSSYMSSQPFHGQRAVDTTSLGDASNPSDILLQLVATDIMSFPVINKNKL